MGAHQNNKPAGKTRKKKSNKGDWGGFIVCEMGKQERKDFKIHMNKSKEGLYDLLLTMVDQGINFSVSWSDKEEAYLAKATLMNDEEGKRYMLTAFHSDVETSIRLLAYKHTVLMDGNWFDRPVDDDEGGNWG